MKQGDAQNRATRVLYDPKAQKGTLKSIGGSQSDDWNDILANQTVQSLWLKRSDPSTRYEQYSATIAALAGIGPKDELEGMMAAQLIAAHNAAMECYRRAMIAEQTFEGRRENLAQAGKLSRTYAVLLDALNRHRGKGQQKVTVEHVHVHAGGQAVVGMVETTGGGGQQKSEDQPHARQIAHASQPAVWSAYKAREPMPVAGDAERPLPDARGTIPGRPEGEPECLQARSLYRKRDRQPARGRGALAEHESPREGDRVTAD
jgi:hypothetical protein